MKSNGRVFKVSVDSISRLGDALGRKEAEYDKLIEARVRKATDIVWRVAHAKRPMITRQQAKAEGRRHYGHGKYARVSDPGASAGVPVQTGALQASITQSVVRKAYGSFVGTVMTHGVKYAGFVEFGTSKMRARPFMRPAVQLTKDALKKVFGARAEFHA